MLKNMRFRTSAILSTLVRKKSNLVKYLPKSFKNKEKTVTIKLLQLRLWGTVTFKWHTSRVDMGFFALF